MICSATNTCSEPAFLWFCQVVHLFYKFDLFPMHPMTIAMLQKVVYKLLNSVGKRLTLAFRPRYGNGHATLRKRCSVRAATRTHSRSLPVHGKTDLSSYIEAIRQAYPFSARVNPSKFVSKVTAKRETAVKRFGRFLERGFDNRIWAHIVNRLVFSIIYNILL
ncbi:hypothetical protein [Moorena sp. SIO3I6]|uniref:hypothetical protein n=1 Tax=Moorena sp. SIO3I6 TaxID=2607831 RepID=UPI0013F74D9C|nr:hypothetical protein [Moorena sp. SIO3I6]NEP22624.1 hypothetical protein [Moorena sp. SIO3I6]